ncbi:hypothetical protein GUJ93_ZPchr0010g8315 [Zizania palustris]|uniref:Uncharacterized protein n=1 Tax=Zizania palustris TaxID=103762 RepID=A0A8J5W6B7_ZIZPA|nr:hypothetical protein GUJ93_ZPchr0010g8315 [Zizania palustris]
MSRKQTSSLRPRPLRRPRLSFTPTACGEKEPPALEEETTQTDRQAGSIDQDSPGGCQDRCLACFPFLVSSSPLGSTPLLRSHNYPPAANGVITSEDA